MRGQSGSSWRSLRAVAKQDCRGPSASEPWERGLVMTFPFLQEIQQTSNSDMHNHRLFLDLSRRSARAEPLGAQKQGTGGGRNGRRKRNNVGQTMGRIK